MDLGQYLVDASIKPSHFAEKLGVSVSTVTRLIRKERKPSIDLAMKIERETSGQVLASDLVTHDAPIEEPADAEPAPERAA